MPFRGGLADRHQRHPGAHLLQFPLRRVPQDPLWPGADPDPVAFGQAGDRAARVRARHLLGTARGLRLRPGELRGRVDRPGIRPRRRAGPRPSQPHLGGGPRRGHRRPLPGATGHGGGDEQEVHQGGAAPLRPDPLAARGQQPLRLFRQEHPGARPGPVRAAQTDHLPAHRQPLPARGLPAHGGAGGRPTAGLAVRPLRRRGAG